MTDKMTDKAEEFFKDYSGLMESVQIMTKTESNPFFGSKYVMLKDVLEEAKKVCRAHNFIFIQMPKMWANGTAVLETRLIHKSEKEMVCEMPLVRKDDNDPQKLGAALTYMRRYSLTSILGIQEADDDGNSASKPNGNPPLKSASFLVSVPRAVPLPQELTKAEVAEHEPRGKTSASDNVTEILRMAIAMKGTDKDAMNYVLNLASFESKKEPGKIIFPKWDSFEKNEKWVHIVLKKIEVEFEKWMKNEDVPF
jgi:hypothetical protein